MGEKGRKEKRRRRKTKPNANLQRIRKIKILMMILIAMVKRKRIFLIRGRIVRIGRIIKLKILKVQIRDNVPNERKRNQSVGIGV